MKRAARGVVPGLLAMPLLAFLIVPVAMLLSGTSGGAVLEALRAGETRGAIGLSLATSGAALCVSVVLGTPLAYWLAGSRSRLAAVVESAVDLPTVLPPSVAGVALLLTFGRNGVIGGWLESMGWGVAFTPAAVVMAQVFVASPYFVRSARAGFAGVGRDLREAATIEGATGLRMVRWVMIPLAARSLGAGAAMCWSRAVGEFGATIIFAGSMPGRTRTMPMAVYLGLEGGLERALVLSAVLIAMSLAVLVVVRVLGWRGAE